MKTASYINRYGDDIIFKQISDNQIEMIGGDYYRVGTNADGVVEFVDPSGGPFIRVGMDVGRYFMDGKIRVIKEISLKDNKATITI